MMEQSHLFTLVIRIFTSINLGVECLQAPDWSTEWILMTSQSDEGAYKQVAHNLGEAPLKVKVLVKPTQGVNEDLVFEASTSQTDDGSQSDVYCGVLYLYDDTNVELFAPNSAQENGRIFCTGNGTWTDGHPDHAQEEHEALVKVLAWKQSSFPAPDVFVDWTYISTTAPDDFVQLPHDLSTDLTFAHVQVRCLDGPRTVYGQGTGDDSLPASNPGAHSAGVLFGYHSAAFKVWAQVSDGQTSPGILAVYGGWGVRGSQTFSCNNGHFRVFGWKEVGYIAYEWNFYLNEGLDMSDMSINPRLWNMETDLISIRMLVLDQSSPNYGVTFQASGQIQTTSTSSVLGGLKFGYGTANLRIFTPNDATSEVIHVTDRWGANQALHSVQTTFIKMKIWSLPLDTTVPITRTIGYKVPMEVLQTPCLYDNIMFCATACAENPDCVAFPHNCMDDGRLCQMWTGGYINNIITSGNSPGLLVNAHSYSDSNE